MKINIQNTLRQTCCKIRKAFCNQNLSIEHQDSHERGLRYRVLVFDTRE